MKVLIADEDTGTRNLVVGCMTDPRIQVVCATEGVQAWQLLSSPNPPRVAILDWVLLNLDGLEICRKIRRRRSAEYTYVIVIGARPGKADLLAAYQAGADNYITKPFVAEELICRVEAGVRVLEKEDKLGVIIRGWRTMLDSLPFGVACLGRTGQLLRANIVFVQLLGYDVEDLVGKTLKQTVLPDATDFSRLMTNIRLSETFDRLEVEMKQSDGRLRRVIVWGRPIPDTKDMVYQIITGVP